MYGPPTTPSSGQPSTTGAHSTLTGDGKDKEASDEHSAPFTAHRAAPKPDASLATKCRAVQAPSMRDVDTRTSTVMLPKQAGHRPDKSGLSDRLDKFSFHT